MTSKRFAKGQILFREGDPANGVFRLLSGAVEVLRDLGGDVILLGTVRAGQFIGEMGVVENRRQRSATLRAATDVEVEILTPTEFLDQIGGSPRAARELIQRLSQRLREADDRIVHEEKRSGQADGNRQDAHGRSGDGILSPPRTSRCQESVAIASVGGSALAARSAVRRWPATGCRRGVAAAAARPQAG